MRKTDSEDIKILTTQIADLKKELIVTEEILKDRTRILEAIPECCAHGNQCVPHALEWIEKAKTLSAIICNN